MRACDQVTVCASAHHGHGVVERQRRFVSDAAHELRTPLAALRVLLEEALLYPDDVDPVTTIEEALRGATRLEAIVADLLFLAWLGAGQTPPGEAVDLTELVTGQIARCSPALLHARIEGQIMVCGVREHLGRLVGALLDNAERHARTLVDVRLHRDGEEAVLIVADDGTGIPPAERERVYEPFARVDTARDRDAGGTGLGLAIARGIAVAHHGTLAIEDGAAGARLVLRLPLAGARQGE